MKKLLKGAVLGAVVGIGAPVAVATGNEVLFAYRSYKDITATRICIADRRWSLFKLEVKHAKGCKNRIVDSIPFCLLFGILGGSLIGALSLANQRSTHSAKAGDEDRESTPITVALIPKAVQIRAITPPRPETTQTSKESPASDQQPSSDDIYNLDKPRKGQIKGFEWETVGKFGAIAGFVAVAGFVTISALQPQISEWNKASTRSESGSSSNQNGQIVVKVNTGGSGFGCKGISESQFETEYLSEGWRVMDSSSREYFVEYGRQNGIPYGGNCSITTYIIER